MKKAIIILGLLIFAGAILLIKNSRSARNYRSYLALDGAQNAKNWVISKTEKKILKVANTKDSYSSPSGGSTLMNGKYEVATCDRFFLGQEVDSGILQEIVTELQNDPELENWIASGERLNQFRRIDFEIIDKKRTFQVLFYCSEDPIETPLSPDFVFRHWEVN